MKRYEQFKFFTKIRKIANWRANSRIPPERDTRRIFDEKGVSAPKKLTYFFKKNRIKNNDFRLKNMKNT